VVGHKYSSAGIDTIDNSESISASLESSREAMQTLILRFLAKGEAVSFGNRIYRFNDA